MKKILYTVTSPAKLTYHCKERPQFLVRQYRGLFSNSHNDAFSLVELSIVLVILGLLTGGVLTGQSLIRAAELRNVTNEFSRYQTAVMTFKDKYFAIPGDMANATDFWGAAPGTSTAGTGTQTMNGNGDGNFDNIGGSGAFNEQTTFWQHLANAGMIEGSYTGMAGPSFSTHTIPGENAPQSKINAATWVVRYLPNEAGGTGGASGIFFEHDYQNAFTFSGVHSNGAPTIAIITSEEAWNIDNKMDDSMPATGGVMAGRFNSCSTTSNESDTTAEYKLSSSTVACSLIFPKAIQ